MTFEKALNSDVGRFFHAVKFVGIWYNGGDINNVGVLCNMLECNS
jgi:hypothetical protein